MSLRPLASTRPSDVPAHECVDSKQAMVDATGGVIAVLEALKRDSTRMRVLGMAAAAYGREGDAEFFLTTARDPSARSARCARCGQIWPDRKVSW
jgi:hypothetical protein